MIKNSSSTTNHDTIGSNLLEAFIAKRDEYPVDRSEAVAMLNKYYEKKPHVQATSEGTAFTQKGKKNDKKDKNEKKSDAKKKARKEGRRFKEGLVSQQDLLFVLQNRPGCQKVSKVSH